MQQRPPPNPPPIPEAVVVFAVAALLLALYARQIPETLERTRAVDWFAQSGPLRIAMHEHYAIHGDWELPAEAKPTATKSWTSCAYGNGRIHCELDGKPATRLDLQPVATAGSVNWACAGNADGDAATQTGARWFHVCRNELPFQPAAFIPEER